MHKYFLYITGCICLLATGCHKQQTRSLPLLNETYRKNDTKPFGGYVAYNHFKKVFNDAFVETINDPFNVEWKRIKDYSAETQYSLYFLVAKNIQMSEEETDAVVDFIKAGNDMFISADYIDPRLLEKIKCETQRLNEIINEVHGTMKQTSVALPSEPINPAGDPRSSVNSTSYAYYYYPFLNYFSDFDSTHTRILGVNEKGQPDYIIMYIGKGRLYLHAAPRVFSNYFLLTAANYHYLENILSWLRFEPKNIYWDEYYKNQDFTRNKKGSGDGQGDTNNFSSFNVIKNNPPLLWAFWLAIIALLLYILVNIKRKQRVINDVKPNTNTTVTFTETVGRLYLQKKNNKNIADKMITYFYEHVRNNYFVNTAQVSPEFMNTLSKKSGVPIAVTQELFGSIERVNSSRNISDAELLRLNELIQKFYKKRT